MKIDIGCGGAKRDGFIGIDQGLAPGVDHILDIEHDRLPFDDNSIEHVYSSHCLEHLKYLNHTLSEIGRVCKDDATIEIIVPYGHHSDALLVGHQIYHTEELWYHLTVIHSDVWCGILNGRWLWAEIDYTIDERVLCELRNHGIAIDFAIRYLNNVAKEIRLLFSYKSDLSWQPTTPRRYLTTSRFGERQTLPAPFDVTATGHDFAAWTIASGGVQSVDSPKSIFKRGRDARDAIVRKFRALR
jgi:SAM-dependent methyltransferase